MGVFLGIVGLFLLGVGANLYRREQERRGRARFVGYIYFKDAICDWNCLVAVGQPLPRLATNPVAWFETLDEVIIDMRANEYDNVTVSQADDGEARFDFDPSLSDEENAERLSDILRLR